MAMRKIYGNVIFPPNAPSVSARLVLIKVHDVSLLDAPSVVISMQRLSNTPIHPFTTVHFFSGRA